MRTRDQLRTYQVETVNFAHEKARCAIWALMGAGKTAAAATAVADWLADFMVRRALVVAPLKVARKAWPAELALWEHLTGLRVALILGDEQERIQAAESDADLYLINYENLAWLVERYLGISVSRPSKPPEPRRRKDEAEAEFKKRLIEYRNGALAEYLVAAKKWKIGKRIGKNRWRWGAIVYDEASKVKSQDSGVFYCAKKIALFTDYVLLLTGTPSPNGYMDLWSQFYLLDGGERLGQTITAYRNRWFDHDPYTRRYTLKTGAKRVIDARIADLVLVVENYAGLPPVVEQEIVLDLPPSVLKQYAQFEKEAILALPEAEIVALTAAGLTNKLLQFANGFTYDDKKVAHAVHEAKLDALAELIDEANGRPILCAYTYQADADRIMARFKQARKLDREGHLVDNWNRGEIPLLLAHPKSAGHGLNMQDGGNLLVWFGLNWSLELFQQFNARLARQGQKADHVFVKYLLAGGTFDATVLAALRSKAGSQDALIGSVKDLIAKHRPFSRPR